LSSYPAGQISWMCGGSESSSMYWFGSGWYSWGIIGNRIHDQPFTESDNGINNWTCGGY